MYVAWSELLLPKIQNKWANQPKCWSDSSCNIPLAFVSCWGQQSEVVSAMGAWVLIDAKQISPKLKTLIEFWNIWNTFWINGAYHLVNAAGAKIVPMVLKIFFWGFSCDLLIYHMLCLLYTFRVCDKYFCFVSTWCHYSCEISFPYGTRLGEIPPASESKAPPECFSLDFFFFLIKVQAHNYSRLRPCNFVKVSLLTLSCYH